MVPMTIPAIAPALKLFELAPVSGSVLPLAVAGGIKGSVVVALTVAVLVVAPLVGRNGAEYVPVVVGV